MDVKRRGSGATVDAIWIIALEDILGVACVNRIECICHLNKTILIKYRGYVIKC